MYDSYVQVRVPVPDFRTAVSGIQPAHLRAGVARPFKEVQGDLRVLLTGRVLVGHAVKNDLNALLLKHDKRYVRDTSTFSRFRELATTPGRTPALCTLAEKLLRVEIQVGAHSSVEDARAAMALFRLEKERFDAEVIARYGHIRVEAPREEIGVGGGERVKRNRDKKKKRRSTSCNADLGGLGFLWLVQISLTNVFCMVLLDICKFVDRHSAMPFATTAQVLLHVLFS